LLLFVCLLATLRKNVRMDLHEILREGWQLASEQMIKFWWRSGSRIRVRIRIRIPHATLIRRALAEVCTVPVLLVLDLLVPTKYCGTINLNTCESISLQLESSNVQTITANASVTALIECGVCVPSNYTGFYIKCNLLRNKEK